MPSAPTNPSQWTTRSLLDWMSGAFAKAGLDSARLMSEMLLAHVLGCDRLRLYTEPDRPASEPERDALRALAARALKHEPVQYLVGEAWFFSLPLRVDTRVLIPRHCTETIVEHVLQHARIEPGFGGRTGEGVVFADVCTGSGAIAIALLKNLPGAHGVACDVSADALDVARVNAATHGVSDRLKLLRGDLLEPLTGHPAGRDLHYLVANPPYIPDSEWDAVDRNVREHEPEMALRAGPDALRFVRPLVEQAPALLRPGGLLLIEIAAASAEEALSLAMQCDALTDVKVLIDDEGLPRVLRARKA